MHVLINITYGGQNGDYRTQMENEVSDAIIRHVCEEAIRNGEVQGIAVRDLPQDAFRHFVVDRFPGARAGEGTRFVVRPKVPFGG